MRVEQCPTCGEMRPSKDTSWFADDLEAAKQAKTPAAVLDVIKGLEYRVHHAGHANSVDSAYQIIRALRMNLEAKTS